MSDTYDSYCGAFGKEQAERMFEAGEYHRHELAEAGLHGSDPFRDAVAIAIGFDCFTSDRFREYHKITVPVADIRKWIREHGDLYHHDGPKDYISVMLGVYNEYIPEMDSGAGEEEEREPGDYMERSRDILPSLGLSPDIFDSF